MNEFKRAERAAFAVGLAIALSVDVIMNVLHFAGLVCSTFFYELKYEQTLLDLKKLAVLIINNTTYLFPSTFWFKWIFPQI